MFMYLRPLIQVAAAADVRPLFSLDQQTLIHVGIQLINACVLAFVMRLILYKPVRKFMQNRTQKILEQFAAADEANAKGLELIAHYEQKLIDLEEQRSNVINTAIVEAEAIRDKMVEEAKKDIAEMMIKAKNDIQDDRNRADMDIKQHIIDVASYMAGKFVAYSLDEDTQNKLFEQSLSELENALR